jgi:hypothetical protein
MYQIADWLTILIYCLTRRWEVDRLGLAGDGAHGSKSKRRLEHVP